jgi:hypothetical protein
MGGPNTSGHDGGGWGEAPKPRAFVLFVFFVVQESVRCARGGADAVCDAVFGQGGERGGEGGDAAGASGLSGGQSGGGAVGRAVHGRRWEFDRLDVHHGGETRAAVEAFAAKDPHFQAGLFGEVEIRPWRVVIGQLA